MKRLTTQTKETLDDLIFEDRNKSYGAYYLRSTYDATIKKAFAFSIACFILIISLVSHFAFKPGETILTIVEMDSARIYECKKIILEPAASQSQNTHKSVKQENSLYTPVAKTEIIKKEDTKPETKPVAEPQPDPGNSGKLPNTNDGEKGGSTKTVTIVVENKEIDPGLVRDYAEVMPEYIGGAAALRKFIITNFRIPNWVEDNIRVKVFFIIDENGKVTDITVSQGTNSALSEEAVRVLNRMPDWKPGKMGGRAVKVRYFLPINIKMQ